MVIMLVLAGCATPTVLREYQPQLAPGYGGRAVALAAQPGHRNNVLVGSESGGLFRSRDGGQSYRLVDRLPRAFITDVEFSTRNARVAIVTALSSYAVGDRGGIWRSTEAAVSFRLRTRAPSSTSLPSLAAPSTERSRKS